MQRKRNKNIIWVTILIYLLTGCLTELPTETEKPTGVITASEISSTPSATVTPGQTDNPVQFNNISEKCPLIMENEFDSLDGLLFLMDKQQMMTYLLDLKNMGIMNLPDTYSFVASINRDMVAYIDSSDSDYQSWKIIITKSDKTQIVLPRKETWSKYLNIYQVTDQGKLLINSDDAFLLIDPFANTEQEIHLTFPDQKPNSENSFWSEPVFDPSMQFVVYPRNPGDENNQKRIVLWNVKSEIPVIYLSSADVYGSKPSWAPDSLKFVIVLSEILQSGTDSHELYVVNINGEIKQLTNFSQSDPHTYPTNYQWSPDSKKIAFWLIVQEDDLPNRLMILDLETGDIQTYCYSSKILTDPVWSPDSQWLLTAVDYKNEFSLISINVINDRIVKVIDNKIPLSWIVGP